MKLKTGASLVVALVFLTIGQPAWAAEPDLTKARPGVMQNVEAGLRQQTSEEVGASPVENKGSIPDGSTAAKPKQATFMLEKLQVSQSAVLAEADLAAIKAKYEGREVSLQDINAAVEEINQLYAQKKNYIAKAVLLPQKVEQGIVKITLAESRIGKYRVEGSSYMLDQYFIERMALRPGELLQLDKLEHDVIRFNKTNSVQLKVVLAKGEGFGTTDVVLKAVEPPRQQTMLFADNAGSEATGQYRAGVNWSISSLKGGGDNFSLNVTKTKGNLGGGVSYQTPVNHFGTQLGFSYSKNQSDVIAGAFQSMQIEGDSYDFSVSLNHPLSTSLAGKLNGFIEVHNKRSDTSFSGATLVDIRVDSAVIGVAEQSSFANGMRYNRFDMTTGNADTKNVAGSQNFTKFNATRVIRQQLPQNHGLLLRLSGQIDLNHDRGLPSTEKFNLGGFSTVRGYKEGKLSGDRGYFISGEYHFPLGKTEGVLFVDHGGAFEHAEPADRDRYMTSAGAGVIAALAENTMLQLFVGIPLTSNKYDDGYRVHFYLQHAL